MGSGQDDGPGVRGLAVCWIFCSLHPWPSPGSWIPRANHWRGPRRGRSTARILPRFWSRASTDSSKASWPRPLRCGTATGLGVNPDLASWDAAVATHRTRLAEVLGAVEVRPEKVRFERVATLRHASLVATSSWVRVEAVRWRAFGEVHGEGLMLVPAAGEPLADVVALPDADVTPEQLAGVVPGLPAEAQYARRLAESGCRVVVPYLVDRAKGGSKVDWGSGPGTQPAESRVPASAGIRDGPDAGGIRGGQGAGGSRCPAGGCDGGRNVGPGAAARVMGWGEGGRLALFCGALDERFRAVGVSGAFGPREPSWEEPLDRNFFGILERWGDAELAGLVSPRALIVEASAGPKVTQPSDGAAPSVLATIPPERVRSELERARRRMSGRARSFRGCGCWRVPMVRGSHGRKRRRRRSSKR